MVTPVTLSTNVVDMKEMVEDDVYLLANQQIPFVSQTQGYGPGDGGFLAWNTKTEWQEQILADPEQHSTGEEDPARIATNPQPTRMFNYQQIFTKSVTGTIEVDGKVDVYGRDSDLDYQVEMKGIELWRDFEFACVGQIKQDRQEGNGAGTPARMGSAYVQLDAANRLTNAGTPRAFDEADLITAARIIETNGGTPTHLFVTSEHAEVLAKWALTSSGYATDAGARVRDIRTGTELVNKIEVYTTPYGRLIVMHDWIMSFGAAVTNVNALVTDQSFWGISTLYNQSVGEFAKDSARHKNLEIYMRKTLCCKNSKASVSIEDLSVSGS